MALAALRPVTNRLALLRRLASLSFSSQLIAPFNSNPTWQNSDHVAGVPSVTPPVCGGFSRQVREPHSEVLSGAASIEQSPAAAAGEHAIRNEPRNDWTREEIQAIYESPLMDLLLYGVCYFTCLWFSHFVEFGFCRFCCD